MRTFFSIAPDSDTAVNIDRWCELCWPGLSRRIPVQNYHMTMAFLDETDDTSLQNISRMLEDFSHPPFSITLNEVGYWAGANVLWLGPREIPQALLSLSKVCRQAANRIGVRGGSKQFTPHLTLARKLDSPPSSPLLEPDFSFNVNSLQLWSSVRKPHGALYNTLSTWELSG